MLILSETYAPVLLVRKAHKLRLSTGNYALHAKHEEWDVSFRQMAQKYLHRPFQLLATPVCFLMCFYASFVFGLLYGSLSAIPIVFEQHRGWSPVTGSLPFLALLLGSVLGLLLNTLNGEVYAKAVDTNGGKAVPEARLYPMMIGSFFMVAGLFVFAWTSTLDIIWVVPCIGLFLIGVGFFPIFQACLNYVSTLFAFCIFLHSTDHRESDCRCVLSNRRVRHCSCNLHAQHLRCHLSPVHGKKLLAQALSDIDFCRNRCCVQWGSVGVFRSLDSWQSQCFLCPSFSMSLANDFDLTVVRRVVRLQCGFLAPRKSCRSPSILAKTRALASHTL